MEKWYNMYSFWVVFLAIFYKLNIIKFSILPSVLVAIIGGITIFLLKLFLGIPMSLQFILFAIIFVHIFPLFLVPYKNVKITSSDIKKNIILFSIYLLFLLIRNKNVFSIYKKVIYENSDINFLELLKKVV
jgi:hypothetical protein